MLIYLYYFIIGILPIFWYKFRHKFIFILFVLSVIGIFFRNYYDQGVYIFTLRSVLFLLFLFITLKYKQVVKFPILTMFLIYIVCLLPFSKYLVASTFGIIDTIMIFLTLPLGYFYFRSINSLKPMVNVAIICYTIFISYIVLLNLGVITMTNTQMDLGYGFFKTGVFSTDEINVISILLILTPFLLKITNGKTQRILFISVTILSAVFLLMNLKRTSIIVPFLALLFYYIAYGKILGIIKFAGLMVVLLVILFSVFGKLFSSQVTSRGYIFESSRYSKGYGESRFDEGAVVIEELNSRPLSTILFGKNVYVTDDIWLERRGFFRILHNDWTSMIVGTGIIGFAFFVFLYFKIIHSVYILNPRSKETKELKIISLSLLLGSIVFIAFGGFFQAVHSSPIMMFFIGSSMGIIDSEKSENSHKNITNRKVDRTALYRKHNNVQYSTLK